MYSHYLGRQGQAGAKSPKPRACIALAEVFVRRIICLRFCIFSKSIATAFQADENKVNW